MTINNCSKNDRWLFEAAIPNCETLFKIGIKIKEKLHEEQTKYQKMEIYDSDLFGKMLVLDGIFQTTEKDEFIYHEMLCHLPMFYHKNPRNILVVGGGDGGSLEEMLKHPVDNVYMVEIDGQVVEACKKYIPSICKDAFENEKAHVIIGDGKEFIKKHENFFDVIALDLSDPIGPAEELINIDFYKDVHKALKDDGVISVQSGSLTWQPQEVATISKRLKTVFNSIKVHKAVIPTYQGGEFSITIAAKFDLGNISLTNIEQRAKKLNLDLKHYTPQIHLASAVLPKCFKDLLK